jgi:hypothetical protein
VSVRVWNDRRAEEFFPVRRRGWQRSEKDVAGPSARAFFHRYLFRHLQRSSLRPSVSPSLRRSQSLTVPPSLRPSVPPSISSVSSLRPMLTAIGSTPGWMNQHAWPAPLNARAHHDEQHGTSAPFFSHQGHPRTLEHARPPFTKEGTSRKRTIATHNAARAGVAISRPRLAWARAPGAAATQNNENITPLSARTAQSSGVPVGLWAVTVTDI